MFSRNKRYSTQQQKTKKITTTQELSSKKKRKFVQTFFETGREKIETCPFCDQLLSSAGLIDGNKKKQHICKQTDSIRYTVTDKDLILVKNREEMGIVLIPRKNDPRCLRLRKIVDDSLGFSSKEIASSTSVCFLYILDSYAVGFLETESSCIFANKLSESGKMVLSDEKLPIKFGVLKIWVKEEFRRQKIATQLIDAARIHFGYPSSVSKDDVAFSQPTSLGKLFAQEYFSTKQFLVYQF